MIKINKNDKVGFCNYCLSDVILFTKRGIVNCADCKWPLNSDATCVR